MCAVLGSWSILKSCYTLNLVAVVWEIRNKPAYDGETLCVWGGGQIKWVEKDMKSLHYLNLKCKEHEVSQESGQLMSTPWNRGVPSDSATATTNHSWLLS